MLTIHRAVFCSLLPAALACSPASRVGQSLEGRR